MPCGLTVLLSTSPISRVIKRFCAIPGNSGLRGNGTSWAQRAECELGGIFFLLGDFALGFSPDLLGEASGPCFLADREHCNQLILSASHICTAAWAVCVQGSVNPIVSPHFVTLIADIELLIQEQICR